MSSRFVYYPSLTNISTELTTIPLLAVLCRNFLLVYKVGEHDDAFGQTFGLSQQIPELKGYLYWFIPPLPFPAKVDWLCEFYVDLIKSFQEARKVAPDGKYAASLPTPYSSRY